MAATLRPTPTMTSSPRVNSGSSKPLAAPENPEKSSSKPIFSDFRMPASFMNRDLQPRRSTRAIGERLPSAPNERRVRDVGVGLRDLVRKDRNLLSEWLLSTQLPHAQ